MTYRVTEKMLDEALKDLAAALGWPETEQYNVKDSLHLAGAYGGWRIEAYCGESGGIRTIGDSGFNPRRQLYEEIRSMAAGARMRKA